MTGAPSPDSYLWSFTRLVPMWLFVSWAMEPRTVVQHSRCVLSSGETWPDQTPVSKSSFWYQDSLCSCTSPQNNFLSLKLEWAFAPTSFPRKSLAYAPVLSCNKPFSTSPQQDSLLSLSCFLWRDALWKPICYIPTSPLHQLYPYVSLRNSKSFPHKAHIPRTLGTSDLKVPHYFPNPSLLCPCLCPFLKYPFPLHSIQVISFSCPREGPVRAPYSASPRISCHILRFWISAVVLALASLEH